MVEGRVKWFNDERAMALLKLTLDTMYSFTTHR